MKPSTTVAICVRLFSIFLLVYLARTVLQSVFVIWDAEDMLGSLLVITYWVGIAFLAAFLWKFPLFVANKLVDFGPDEPENQELDRATSYNVGFVLLGILFLYWGVSDLVYWVSYMSMMESFKSDLGVAGDTAELISASDRASMIATAVELLIALFLLFGGKRLTGLFMRLRTAGT